jgi:cell division protein FtsB
MYLKQATRLLGTDSNAFLPGSPTNAMMASGSSKEEYDKLRKENAELKKRIEQMKSKK